MRSARKTHRNPTTLLAEFLRWFIRLRWLAASVTVLAAALDWQLIHAYSHGGAKVAVGAGVMIYNAALWLILRWRSAHHPRRNRGFLLGLAWVQIIFDMI